MHIQVQLGLRSAGACSFMVVGYADMLTKAGPLDTGDVAALKQKHQYLP